MPASVPAPELAADCSRCFGLCCVMLAFTASAEFAIDKPANTPCPNLLADSRCGIHADLRGAGFAGCATYECFGAGQYVSQVICDGRDWRTDPRAARQAADAFATVRALHELLRYLAEALALVRTGPLNAELRRARDATEALTRTEPGTFAGLDLPAHRTEVNALLTRASESVRGGRAGPAADYRGADLVGAKLRGADLRAANLRGARLIAADLSRADLRGADVTGADLRGAELAGADLRSCLFLVQAQLDSARGDAATRLPANCAAPAHWPR